MPFSEDNRLLQYAGRSTVERRYRLLEVGVTYADVAAAAATTRYLNVSAAGTVSMGAAVVAIPAGYAVKITAVCSSAGGAPDSNNVFLTDGTVTAYLENGTDQHVLLPDLEVWIGHGSGFNLGITITLAAATTMDAIVSYELYEVERDVVERFVNV